MSCPLLPSHLSLASHPLWPHLPLCVDHSICRPPIHLSPGHYTGAAANGHPGWTPGLSPAPGAAPPNSSPHGPQMGLALDCLSFPTLCLARASLSRHMLQSPHWLLCPLSQRSSLHLASQSDPLTSGRSGCAFSQCTVTEYLSWAGLRPGTLAWRGTSSWVGCAVDTGSRIFFICTSLGPASLSFHHACGCPTGCPHCQCVCLRVRAWGSLFMPSCVRSICLSTGTRVRIWPSCLSVSVDEFVCVFDCLDILVCAGIFLFVLMCFLTACVS